MYICIKVIYNNKCKRVVYFYNPYSVIIYKTYKHTVLWCGKITTSMSRIKRVKWIYTLLGNI